MPLDPSIYQQLQPNIAGQLAGSLNQFTEQRARLSDLASQREQQAITQGYQNRALQRAEEAIPAQQAELARAKSEKAYQDISLGIYGGLTNNKSPQEITAWASQKGAEFGLTPNQINEIVTPLNTAQDLRQATETYRQQAGGRKLFEQEQEARLKTEKQTPSALSNIYAERDRLAAINPNDPRLKQYDQLIEKTIQPSASLISMQSPNWSTTQTSTGELIQVNPKTGETRPLNVQGKSAAEKPLTEGQSKAFTFGTRALASHDVLNKSGIDYSQQKINAAMAVENIPGVNVAANAALNETEQKVMQAQRDFVNAVLRQESGAAIGTSEFKNAIKQYFPQPGDKPEVINQKSLNRQRVIEGFKKGAGPAAKDFEETLNLQLPTQTGGAKFLGFE